MDPGTALAVAELGFSVVRGLVQIVEGIRGADETINKICDEVQAVSAVLQSIHGTLEVHKIEVNAVLPGSQATTLQNTFVYCKKIFLILQDVVAKNDRRNAQGFRIWTAKIMWPFRQEKVVALISELERRKTTLTLNLNSMTFLLVLKMQNSSMQAQASRSPALAVMWESVDKMQKAMTTLNEELKAENHQGDQRQWIELGDELKSLKGRRDEAARRYQDARKIYDQHGGAQRYDEAKSFRHERNKLDEAIQRCTEEQRALEYTQRLRRESRAKAKQDIHVLPQPQEVRQRRSKRTTNRPERTHAAMEKVEHESYIGSDSNRWDSESGASHWQETDENDDLDNEHEWRFEQGEHSVKDGHRRSSSRDVADEMNHLISEWSKIL